ncbi:citrate synthase/methylcitrate synthase [Gracilibacillus sp. S3-1-1]|uniref:Citrate synthase/methylcitrate synthase n=1 Tax=Gracilibacillus pellucidus TaxID=3095368 RepID=A0ACC6M220_9BACI|nr:citrate synthase/methylcitrate synthase [Gracilibacillus sp. S3-1-1]MDX8044994.1 citrate synthase/methylcitrate synthase [Gracilibacillus sp. S3-1-1]
MLNQGLKGVVAAETSISHIDGEKGQLIYRGYEAKDLTKSKSFEEVAFLLWFGHLPSAEELEKLNGQLIKNRYLTETMKQVMNHLPHNMEIMSVIRTVISAEGTTDYGWKPTVEQAIRLTALVPTIIAYWYNKINGKSASEPNDTYSHVENYLYMLNGTKPTKAQVDGLETYMILTVEHGMNASTFSARVTASTESDLVSSITTAIGTMKGPLHGGAPSGVIQLLEEIATPDNADKVIREKINNREKLMGFGHRVYKTHDPRAVALRETLLASKGEDEWLDLAVHVEDVAINVLNELKPGRALYTNVEFYAAAIMKSIDFDPDLFTPTFTASRMVGWTAHVLEQAENNTIYRPESVYVGEMVEVAEK